ncbi:MAG TPA: 50S ribosomal protein L5 [Rhodothermales bacterium]|nr:50S ribosomal protein L5 [Bacteroidetes Order II. bacterium]HCR48384.1 50S ribosomal protein L5 [Bacteroidota bacterium]HRK72838.1 50S ribosomal protein L5 [Rhodothermales bacterium]HRR09688.1 50S ribosomal protein L5 [Rhodothermales bacterium]
MSYTARLRAKYLNEVVPALVKQFGYKNIMEVPKLVKISVNKGLGDANQNKKLLDDTVEELRKITGQHPVVSKAKKSISNFKLREGMPVGVFVTLRGDTMYEFLDRFITLALPRERDFKGVSDKSFDGRGNYTLGLKEQIIFPEIDIDKVERIGGMDISFVTTAKTDAEAYALLKEMGIPFVRRDQK